LKLFVINKLRRQLLINWDSSEARSNTFRLVYFPRTFTRSSCDTHGTWCSNDLSKLLGMR